MSTISDPRPKSWRSIALRITAIAWGVGTLVLALGWFVQLGMAGFPDGYITPYARQTALPQNILAWGCVLQSLYFVARGLFARMPKTRRLLLQMLVAGLVTIAPVLILESCPESGQCSEVYQAVMGEPMDDGAGG